MMSLQSLEDRIKDANPLFRDLWLLGPSCTIAIAVAASSWAVFVTVTRLAVLHVFLFLMLVWLGPVPPGSVDIYVLETTLARK
jgi:hypothetical protein